MTQTKLHLCGRCQGISHFHHETPDALLECQVCDRDPREPKSDRKPYVGRPLRSCPTEHLEKLARYSKTVSKAARVELLKRNATKVKP